MLPEHANLLKLDALMHRLLTTLRDSAASPPSSSLHHYSCGSDIESNSLSVFPQESFIPQAERLSPSARLPLAHPILPQRTTALIKLTILRPTREHETEAVQKTAA